MYGDSFQILIFVVVFILGVSTVINGVEKWTKTTKMSHIYRHI